MTTVDVLIPHYNDSKGLAFSLDCIIRQDWDGNFRVVVADDGSKPDEVKAVEELLDKAPIGSVLVKNSENRGRPYTRNALLDSMESPFVAWLDAGDAWAVEKTRLQAAAAREFQEKFKSDHFWVTCSYRWVQENVPPRRHWQVTGGDAVQALLIGAELRAYLWTILAPRRAMSAVGWFDENLPRLQDLDFFIRFGLKGGAFHSTDPNIALATYYKQHKGRAGREVMACHEYLFNKYAYLYHGYGELFAAHFEYKMIKNSRRFAKANGDEEFREQLKLRARRLKARRALHLAIDTMTGSTSRGVILKPASYMDEPEPA